MLARCAVALGIVAAPTAGTIAQGADEMRIRFKNRLLP